MVMGQIARFVVYSSTSLCFCESRTKFALQVASKYKVRLGLYFESDAATWAATPLLTKNEKIDQPLGRGGGIGYSFDRSVKSGLGDALDDTMVLHYSLFLSLTFSQLCPGNYLRDKGSCGPRSRTRCSFSGLSSQGYRKTVFEYSITHHW